MTTIENLLRVNVDEKGQRVPEGLRQTLRLESDVYPLRSTLPPPHLFVHARVSISQNNLVPLLTLITLQRGARHAPIWISMADVSMRLELATERQKRQLAEDKLRQLEEKATLYHSGTTLLSAAVQERQTSEAECERLRHWVDELRQDNETLASMVEQLSADCKGAEKFAADTISERDAKQRENLAVRAELQDVRLSRQKLEERLASDAQQLSLLAAALGEKDTTLADLQEHFKSIAEKLRAANDGQAVATAKHDQLSSTIEELRKQTVSLKCTQELMTLTHQETAHRFVTMLMKEEGTQNMMHQQWSACVRDWIPALESDVAMVGRAWGDTREQLDHSQAALEQSISEAQRRRGVPRATQTLLAAVDIDDTERERDAAVAALQDTSERRQVLESECRELQAEVEARKDALSRLHARRKTPSVHALSRFTSVASASSSPKHNDQGEVVHHADPSSVPLVEASTVDSLYHRGEALVMKQRLEAMMQRMLGQTQEYEAAMKENERLKEEIQALRTTNSNNPPLPHSRSDGERHDHHRWETSTALQPSSQFEGERDAHLRSTTQLLHALEKRVDLAERQLLDAKQRIHEVEGERDRALREAADAKRNVASIKADLLSYQSSMEDLQAHARNLELTRIPRDIHQQDLALAQSAAADAVARIDALHPQLASERARRLELENEVHALKSLQSLTLLQETNKKLQHDNDSLRLAVEDVRSRVTNSFEAELMQRDIMVADAAKRLMEASDELDAVEFEKQSLRRECHALRSRIDAMLTLQERTTRSLV